MKGIEGSAQKRRYKKERYFTPKKFLITGQEMLVEMRGSLLHTRRGKMGVLVFAIGMLWGIYEIAKRNMTENSASFSTLLWCTIGMVMFLNLENHKLMYLLPISRKEFAASQIRRMAWFFLVIAGIQVLYLVCAKPEMNSFWRMVLYRVIPVSVTLSISQITAVKPVKNSEQTGDKIYHLSYAVMIPTFSIGMMNFWIETETWSVWNVLLSLLNYGMNLWAIIYVYRKLGFADVYYDEL